jgi:hypothetical protein
MAEIVNLFVDGMIESKEAAAELVDREAKDAAEFYGIDLEEAKKKLLSNIGYVTGYLSHDQADRMMELFATEHPVWGRRHPTPEEAFELGLEYGTRDRKENTWQPKSTTDPNQKKSTNAKPARKASQPQPR